jgi:hypothetical protein
MRSVPPVVFVSLLGLAACAPAGSSAYVTANAAVTGDCATSDTLYQATGIYDVLSKGSEKKNCVAPYQLNLVINSNLQTNSDVSVGRAEPNTLLVTYGDVRLMDKSEATLGFKTKDNLDDPARPNPFRVRTAVSIAATDSDDPSKGTVQLNAIPSTYADQLRGFAGDSILVEVQLYGTTTGDVDVDFPPFVYPLTICSDCRSTCKGDPKWVAEPGDLTDLNAGECEDNRPQDNRWCVDPDC